MYYYIVTCVLTIVLGPYLMPLDQGCLGCTNAWLSGVLKINKTFVKELCLLKLFLLQMFCTTGLVSSKRVAQMYEGEIHFGKLLFK